MSETLGRPGMNFAPPKDLGADPNTEILNRALRESGSDRGDKFERTYLYTDSSFISLTNHLKELHKAKDDGERSKTKEALEKDWEHLAVAQLRQTDSLLDDQFLRFKNPYPYESRQPGMWFDTHMDAITKATKEEWGNSPEARAWLKQVESDIYWGKSNFKLVEGFGGMIEKFWDGGMIISSWVRERFRSDPVPAFYEGTFAKSVPGQEVTAEMKASLSGEAQRGLREKAVKYQDESIYWRTTVAATHQYDIDNPANPTALRKTTSAERALAQRLFVLPLKTKDGWVSYKGKTVPESMMNWYSMPSTEELKRKYIATMQALLIENAKEGLMDCDTQGLGGQGDVDATKFGELIHRIEATRDTLLQNWFSGEKDVNTLLSAVVTKAGIVHDWGHIASAPMSWGFDYDEKGERSVTGGGTTTATDSNTPYYWAYNDISTRTKDWPGGTLPKPSKEFAKKVKEGVPYITMGGEESEIIKDEFVRKFWNELWSPRVTLPDGTTKDVPWDPNVEKWLKKMVWNWPTKLGMPFPVFIPPSFESLNFYNTITLEPGKKAKYTSPESSRPMAGEIDGKTIWDEIRSGKGLSDMEWSKMGDQALYRWLITISSFSRFWVTAKEEMKKSNEEQFLDFFGNSDNLKELMKRVDLGMRDERIPVGIMTLAVIPMAVVVNRTEFDKAVGTKWDDKETRTAWAADISDWLIEMEGLAPKKDKIENYNIYMYKLGVFYAQIMARMAKLKSDTKRVERQKGYDVLRRLVAISGERIEDENIHNFLLRQKR